MVIHCLTFANPVWLIIGKITATYRQFIGNA